MRVFFVGVLSFCFTLLAMSQDEKIQFGDTLSHKKFATMVNLNRDQSYITAGQGFGNQTPLIFEGNLSPSFFVSDEARRWALLASPQIQMRMLNQFSVPIRTPSYRVYMTYFRGIDFWDNHWVLKKIFYDEALWFASFVHHSNGQDGPFYDSTGNINLYSGNFAANFLQLGLASYSSQKIGTNYYSIREMKVHTEIYPAGWCDDHLVGNYGFYRLFMTYTLLGIKRKDKSDWFSVLLKRSSLEIKSGWIFGALRGYSESDVKRRFIIDINYKYYPEWLAEFAFFVRYYYGQDYYNIHFETQLSNLTFGLTSSIVKVSNAVRYLSGKKYISR